MKKLILVLLITAVLSGCMIIIQEKLYTVHYNATTLEARAELQKWIQKNGIDISYGYASMLPSNSPYWIKINARGLNNNQEPFQINLGSPGELRHSEEFKELRRDLERKLGPKLMRLLKVRTEVMDTLNK